MSRNRYLILWILILAAALRFIQIDTPPVGRHAWRQCDTASVARNFEQNDHRLLYPQIDWEIPGYVEMEFPLYPWVASLLYRATGESAATARALAVLGALASIGFFYLIVRRILGEQTALWSAFLYAVLPLNLFFGRAIMPESWMLAATAGSIYFFLRWVDDESWLYYSLAILVTTLACLLKLTSLYLGLPLLWLAWQKWGRAALGRWQLWLFAGLLATSLFLWYSHAWALGQIYGASFNIITAAGSDKWGTWDLLLDPDFYHQVFVGNLGGRMLTWAGYPVFLVGLFLQRRAPRERLFDVWLMAVIVMLLLVSFGAYHHDYYSLPIMFPAAVFMGKAFDRGWPSRRPLLAVVLALILILSGYRYLGTLAEERIPSTDTLIAENLASHTVAGDLVISCNSANPVWLYLSGRRGWGRDCQSLDRVELRDLIREGARYLVARSEGDRTAHRRTQIEEASSPGFEVITDDELLLLVRLTPPPLFDTYSWHEVHVEDFTETTSIEAWDLAGGSWTLEDGLFEGTRVRRLAAARSRFKSPECDVCSAKITLTLLRPGPREDQRLRSRRQRGAGRSNSRAALDLWWRDPGTGVTLGLATKAGEISVYQFENGDRVDAARTEFPLEEARIYQLELRSNGLDLELLIDGESVLATPFRLTSPLFGAITLRPGLGSIQMKRLALLQGTVSAEPAPDRR